MKKIEYKLGDNLKNIIDSSIYTYYNEGVEFKGPNPEGRELIISTGIGVCLSQIST